jgi:hypothetical protein
VLHLGRAFFGSGWNGYRMLDRPSGMSPRFGLPAIIMIAMAVLTSCASGHAHQVVGSPLAIHTTNDARILLIDVPEDTADPDSPCWVYYKAVLKSSHSTFTIGDEPDNSRRPRRILASGSLCPSDAIKGPFYATVHLPTRYSGQVILDYRTHEPITLAPMINLADAPARLR